MILDKWKNLPPIVLAETPEVKLTMVEIKNLEESEFLIILGRVSPSGVWRIGDVLVVEGSRDYYEFKEVRNRIIGGLKRFYVVKVEDCATCSSDNLVQKG